MSLNRFRRDLFGLARHQKLLKVPRQYANEVRDLTFDDAHIMALSSARSPENVKALMKRHQATTIDELWEKLPDQRYRRRPVQRFVSMLRRIGGGTAHNPDTRRARELKRAGYISKREIHARVQAVKEFI